MGSFADEIYKLLASANSSDLIIHLAFSYIGHSLNWKNTHLSKCLLSHFISQTLIFRVPRFAFLRIIYLAALSEDLLTLYINVALVASQCRMLLGTVDAAAEERRSITF